MKQDKYRISLDFALAAKANIERLLEKSGCVSLVEMFRKAIALLELVLDVQAANGKIVIEHSDGTREGIRIL